MRMKITQRLKKKKREIKIEQFKRLIFHNFQKRDHHCDITVTSADGATSIRAHRVILAAKLNAVKTAIRSSPVMQTTMNAAVLQKIVEFCYTNEVCLESSLQTFSLLKYATEYGITELVEKCRTFLNSTIAAAPPSAKPLPTDSIGKYQKNLNSTIVAASPIRKPLRTDSIEKCQTYLNSTISAAPQSPQPLATQQNLIIFGDLDEQTCFSAEMLVSMDAKWKELAELNGWQKFARRLTSVAYRGDDCVVVSGGLDILKSKQLVHLVDLKLGKIAALPPMKTARCEHASIVHNNFLYVAGGMKQGEHLDSVEKLELKRRRWTSVPPMGNKRTLFSMVVADGLIYAIGGENELECTKLVEYYDPDKKVWMNTAPMIKPRASAGVAVLNNAIYAVGGSTVFKYGDTDTVERFDLDSKQWSLIASMNYSRCHVTCCVYENSLIAAGGYDFASHPVDFVEVYDEKTNKWIRSTAMNKARGRCLMFTTTSNRFCIKK